MEAFDRMQDERRDMEDEELMWQVKQGRRRQKRALRHKMVEEGVIGDREHDGPADEPGEVADGPAVHIAISAHGLLGGTT